jgi:Fur family ferric uptake transcriptional regulator
MKTRAKRILEINKLKYSRQRESVIDLLSELEQPVSVETCYDLLKEKGESMNLSTVYRTVDTLHQHHIIDKVYNSITNTTMVQIIKNHHQHYIICVSCHKMIPIDFCPMEQILENVENKYHFKVTAHQLEISGYCKECLENTSSQL